ncbi:hypothetical protein GCM10007047_10410 [Cerasicoccus arenae]|uniref:Glycosyltransferase RgtA/B/C/D-like domain-containing protein n=1 Tax=Cerasicoccus arenae TaxID=424488 RepID=A0A8J3DFT9_9BACT|nr:hypothetical protein GCM10007047_10410 [Cerasicoccus arenae]
MGCVELLVTVLAIALAVLLIIAAASVAYGAPLWHIWSKEFWLDELYTYFMVLGYPGKTLIEALSQGGDYNPPALYMALKGWSSFFGVSESAFRAFSSACVFIGLVSVYYMLGSRFSRLVCFVTTVGFWATTGGQLIVHSFEARFYGPWFAGVAVLCLLLVRPAHSRVGRGLRYVLIALVSVWICSVHYFGVISLGLIGASHVLLDFRTKDRWRDVAALLPGVLALAVFIPLYQSQRSLFADAPATWIADPTFAASVQFLRNEMLLWFVGVPLAFLAVQLIVRIKRPPPPAIDFLRTFAAPLGLVVFPLVLVTLSWLVQPVMMARYCMPYLICWVPMVALILSRSVIPVRLLVFAAFLWIGQKYCLGYLVLEGKRADSVAHHYLEDAQPSNETPIYASTRLAAYPLWHYGKLPRDSVGILFLPQGGDERLMLVEVKNHLALEGLGLDQPHLTTPQLLQAKESFYFLVQGNELAKISRFLPGYDVERLADPIEGDFMALYRFTRPTSPSP